MRVRALPLLAAALLIPGRADAHLVNTGFGPFYDGISHLFVTAPDLLAAIALALLAGLRSPASGRTLLFGMTGAWSVGGLLGLALGPDTYWTLLTTISFLVAGALLAADRELPAAVVPGLGAAVGLAHGFLNGAESASSGVGFVGFVGSVSALFVVLALAAALAVTLREGWTRIAVRVAGSWIAAVGLLRIGWLLRPQA